MLIDMNPKDAIKLDIAKLNQTQKYSEKEALPDYGLHRYLYQLGEQHGDQKKQATDLNSYRLDQVVEDSRNRVLHYLRGEIGSAFVRKELMCILEHTQASPEWVSKWK